MSTQELTLAKQACQSLALMEDNIKKALPQNVPSQRFMRTAQMAMQLPIIADAINKGADRSSLFDAVSRCAQDGLVLDSREAALVPFKGKIQYMPMVAGIIKKAYNSGEIASLSAHVVYENDDYSYELGDNEHIKHIPTDGNPGKIVAVYAIGKLKSGGIQRVWMNERQITKHRKVAKTDFIWKAWEEEMWEKTALRKLAKRLPQSSELERLFEADNETIDLDVQKEPVDITAKTEDQPGKDGTQTSASAIVANASKGKSSDEEPPADSYAEVIEVSESEEDDVV